jgi:hypothetical protein
VSRLFDGTQCVDDVVRLTTYIFDSTAMPTQFRLCLFDDGSNRTCWFVDGRYLLSNVGLFANRARTNDVALSLLRVGRVDDPWRCVSVTRAVDDCAAWLVDTPEICALMQRRNRSLSSSSAKIPLSASQSRVAPRTDSSASASSTVAPPPLPTTTAAISPPLLAGRSDLASSPRTSQMVCR